MNIQKFVSTFAEDLQAPQVVRFRSSQSHLGYYREGQDVVYIAEGLQGEAYEETVFHETAHFLQYAMGWADGWPPNTCPEVKATAVKRWQADRLSLYNVDDELLVMLAVRYEPFAYFVEMNYPAILEYGYKIFEEGYVAY